MAVATFDTLKFANALKAAGVPEKQAEAEATVLSEALQLNLKDLATKDDLNATKIAIKDDLNATKVELKREIEDLRKEVKQELKELEQRTNTKFDDVRKEVKDSEQRVNARIDLLAAEMKTLRAELKGEMLLIKWMFGAVTTIGVGLLIRLFLMRGPI